MCTCNEGKQSTRNRRKWWEYLAERRSAADDSEQTTPTTQTSCNPAGDNEYQTTLAADQVSLLASNWAGRRNAEATGDNSTAVGTEEPEPQTQRLTTSHQGDATMRRDLGKTELEFRRST
ncbi:hypothetical protein R1sor_018428 [Riccia sorocarpa]|uniref:Uncharacterized protein n=1 Tax=Riccia sorocarpa TaxID=122646 RepID=A0ABD3IDR4_9MARC